MLQASSASAAVVLRFGAPAAPRGAWSVCGVRVDSVDATRDSAGWRVRCCVAPFTLTFVRAWPYAESRALPHVVHASRTASDQLICVDCSLMMGIAGHSVGASESTPLSCSWLTHASSDCSASPALP